MTQLSTSRLDWFEFDRIADTGNGKPTARLIHLLGGQLLHTVAKEYGVRLTRFRGDGLRVKLLPRNILKQALWQSPRQESLTAESLQRSLVDTLPPTHADDVWAPLGRTFVGIKDAKQVLYGVFITGVPVTEAQALHGRLAQETDTDLGAAPTELPFGIGFSPHLPDLSPEASIASDEAARHPLAVEMARILLEREVEAIRLLRAHIPLSTPPHE